MGELLDGEEGRSFEREFAAAMGCAYAVALDLALQALGIGADDEVVVTPRTFIASASCIVNAGEGIRRDELPSRRASIGCAEAGRN